MDLRAIAAALATKYVGLQPVGEPMAVRSSTADPPNDVVVTPAVIVMSADDPADFDYGGQTRMGTVPFVVDFLLAPTADVPRFMASLQRWAPVLLDATLVGIHLGLPLVVAQTWASSFQIAGITYGGQLYAGVRLVVKVRVSEPIAPTA